MNDPTSYLLEKSKALNYYNSLSSTFCRAFKSKVIFSAEGFNHIIFTNARSERERASQITRFRLLPLAEKLIKLTTTYQEYEELYMEVVIKKNKQKIKSTQRIRYWGLIAILDNNKIKVIIRQKGTNGLLHFWSIIPAWTTNKYRDAKFISTMKGNPELD